MSGRRAVSGSQNGGARAERELTERERAVTEIGFLASACSLNKFVKNNKLDYEQSRLTKKLNQSIGRGFSNKLSDA